MSERTVTQAAFSETAPFAYWQCFVFMLRNVIASPRHGNQQKQIAAWPFDTEYLGLDRNRRVMLDLIRLRATNPLVRGSHFNA